MDISGKRLDIAKQFQEIWKSNREKDGTAGSAAIIKDGELLAAFTFGTQDGNPENPATVHDLYGVGSVGKIYCALAVMKLVEMGRVSLDAPVVDYIPQFIMKDERFKQITLRMCLNHSAGLSGTHYKKLFSNKWDNSNVYNSFFTYYKEFELKTNPGEISIYSNDGYLLLEIVVTKMAGMSYTRFIQEYIAKPAGALSVCSGENIPKDRAYIRAKGKAVEYTLTIGAGGILTDLTDCAKIGYLFIDHKGILTPESINEITCSQGKLFYDENTVISSNCGLGWDNVQFTDDFCDFGDNALMKSGSTPVFGSFLLVNKKYNFSLASSRTNDNDMFSMPTMLELCSQIINEYGNNTHR